MINQVRSWLIGVYIDILNQIELNTSVSSRVVLFVITCWSLTLIKIKRILLYYLKTGALPIVLNPTQNQRSQRQSVLRNEKNYRYVLNFVIIMCYVVGIVLLESTLHHVWGILAGIIIYFIIYSGCFSYVDSVAHQLDDITVCNSLLFFKKIFFCNLIWCYNLNN